VTHKPARRGTACAATLSGKAIFSSARIVLILRRSLTPLRAGPGPCAPTETPGPISATSQEARMKFKLSTTLIAVGAVVLTSAVTPASAARRGVAWRNAAVAAGIAAAAAAASGAYYSGYGYGRYGYYGYGHCGRCGGGAYC
jgi:hypothetical protein